MVDKEESSAKTVETVSVSASNLEDGKEEERKAFTSVNFGFWKTKAADLANGVPDD
jgi:hypothetical protein